VQKKQKKDKNKKRTCTNSQAPHNRLKSKFLGASTASIAIICLLAIVQGSNGRGSGRATTVSTFGLQGYGCFSIHPTTCVRNAGEKNPQSIDEMKK